MITIPEDDPIFDKYKEILQRYIADQGLKHSVERPILLALIYRHTRPFDAQTLWQETLTEDRVSRATVFNALDFFTRCGILVRLPNKGNALYLMSHIAHNNAVVYCRNCGKVILYRKPTLLAKLRQTLKPPRMRRIRPVLIMYGLCSECDAAFREKKKKGSAKEHSAK